MRAKLSQKGQVAIIAAIILALVALLILSAVSQNPKDTKAQGAQASEKKKDSQPIAPPIPAGTNAPVSSVGEQTTTGSPKASATTGSIESFSATDAVVELDSGTSTFTAKCTAPLDGEIRIFKIEGTSLRTSGTGTSPISITCTATGGTTEQAFTEIETGSYKAVLSIPPSNCSGVCSAEAFFVVTKKSLTLTSVPETNALLVPIIAIVVLFVIAVQKKRVA